MKPRPPMPAVPTAAPTLRDLTLLLDGPVPPRGDSAAQAAEHEAVTHTLDAALRMGLSGNALLVTVRQAYTARVRCAADHAARPAVLKPEGHAAPADALPRRFVALLHPGVTPDAAVLQRGLDYLHRHPRVAAVVGQNHRTDGNVETHVVPGAVYGGATLLRTAALRQAGGFSRLMMPGGAADLDLTCRLLRNGHGVERFADFSFDRPHWPAARLDAGQDADALRDALIVQDRYLPRAHRRILRRDTVRQARAAWAQRDEAQDSALLRRALGDARRWAQWERKRGRSTLTAEPLEALLGWVGLRKRVAEFAREHGVRRVVLAGLHPHLYGFVHAAHAAHLTIDAIADLDERAGDGAGKARYRRVPVWPLERAIRPGTEAVVISALHPATATRASALVAESFAGPVLFPSAWPVLPQRAEVPPLRIAAA